ncbi:MAG: exo-alpha-sialidase, partial [Eudoraea sp.]|nr:glycoside hydrolase [Eudoraea sp.]NNJ40154.1 exo-alpha-sialidase [Eudoraea sp.]
GPHTARMDNRWLQTGHNPWKAIMGGDGMQVQIDNRNPNIVYTGFQFGNYYRLDLGSGKRKAIQPKHELGETPYRFNWQTPILLSPHNQDILYFGGNKLHRSLNQGDRWEAISDDLTAGGKKGNVAYGTLTSISESPFKFGLLYVGSDDGMIHMSKDGGGNWENISASLPKNLWVSRVVASKHKIGRVYATLNGYRWDDFTPYVYKSEDFGKTWVSIGEGLPPSPVNVITEDPDNENLLFVGTDDGLYATLDQGATWQWFQQGIPYVAVHDLVIQPEAKHLVVGTHGRSIYRADISHLQLLDAEIMKSPLYVFELDKIRHSPRWGNSYSTWGKPVTPGLDIVFYSSTTGPYTAYIRYQDDIVVSEVSLEADKGLNVLSYDLAFSKQGKTDFLKKIKKELKKAQDGKTYLPKGEYTVELEGKRVAEKVSFTIE